MMSFKKVPLLFSIVAFFYGINLTAQIKGIVVDEGNTPLEYATVAIYKQADKALIAGIVTDSLGGFSFTNIAKGSYFLKVSFIGYNEKTINSISISNSKSSVDLGIISLSLGNSLYVFKLK
jgi:iron complex outermembrane recepter protein